MTLLGLASLAIVSCSKEATLKNRLDGETWKHTKVTTKMMGKTTEQTNPTSTVTLNDDGTGYSKSSETASEAKFNWEVIADGDSLRFTSGNSKLTYKVLSNKKNSQIWILGDESKDFIKVELEKQ